MGQMRSGVKVSVVTPYYNSADSIVRALDSIKNQTVKDLEIITVDDGSSDNGFEVIEAYKNQNKELRITNVKQHNQGPSAARNNGMAHSHGTYVAFLDSDDTWLPDKLEKQLKFMDEHQEVMMTGTNYRIIGKDSEKPKYSENEGVVFASYNRMLFKVMFYLSTVMIRRTVVAQDNIQFRVGKNQGEDLLFFLQIARRYPVARLSESLTYRYKEEYGQSGLTGDLPALLRNDLDNIRILMTEKDHGGKTLSPIMGWALMGYTYLKHSKRVIVAAKNR